MNRPDCCGEVSGGAECNGGHGREVHPPDGIGVSEEPGRDSKCDRHDDEKERRNHLEESIRPARYAKAICCSRVSVKYTGARCKHISVTPRADRRLQLLRPCESLGKPRLAAIRSIFVDDPALGGFIDSRD